MVEKWDVSDGVAEKGGGETMTRLRQAKPETVRLAINRFYGSLRTRTEQNRLNSLMLRLDPSSESLS